MEINILKEKIKETILSPSYRPTKVSALYGSDNWDCAYEEFRTAIASLISEYIIAYQGSNIASASSVGIFKGRFIGNSRGFGFFEAEDEKDREALKGDLFIPKAYTMGAIEGDNVAVRMTKPSEDGKRGGEGEVIEILSHTLTEITGSYYIEYDRRVRNKKYHTLVSDDRHISFPIEIDNPKGLNEGDKLLCEIIKYPVDFQPCYVKVIENYGDEDSIIANYKSILHQNGIKESFPSAVLAQADEVSKKEITADGRLDLRNKIILTIDSESAKDLDDAVSVEKTENGYILGVHIADVSEYVKEGTALDAEAFERGTSVYFIDKVVPMLPTAISNGCCSLNSGTDKYTLSAIIKLDEEGEIIETSLHEAIINTSVRGVYSEINEILDNGGSEKLKKKYGSVLEMLPVMRELYEKLEAKGRKKGALDLETVEAKIILDDEGYPVDIVKEERGISERIIEQFMLCANEGVANYLFWQDMPCIYRIHEEPDDKKIQGFSVFCHNLGLDIKGLKSKNGVHSSALQAVMNQVENTELQRTVTYMLLRSLMKAKYSPDCQRHFGLAIDKYCHFTSPIRRYPDLSVHRIIKKLLHGEMTGEGYELMCAFAARSAEKSTENEIRAQNAERAIEDIYKAAYMSDFIGERFSGIISSVTSFGIFVELDNTCEGLVPLESLGGDFEFDEETMSLSYGYTTYKLGRHVTVEIADANLSSGRIEMELISEDD